MRTTLTVSLIALAVAWMCQVPASARQDPAGGAMLADVARMDVDSNEGRREVLESILARSGVQFERQSVLVEPGPENARTEGANLVVTLGRGGTDIVVGAHYDAARLADGSLSRGAVDNAASSIVLTRLASTLASASVEGAELRHRVHVVFFDMEEIGLLGSRRFVEAHEHAIEAAVNMDVNGYGDHVFFGPTAPPGNQHLHRVLAETCVAEEIPCQPFPQYPASDYISFQRAGIPNVSLSVLPSVETHQLWLFLNSERRGVFAPGFLPRVFGVIHTPADAPDLVEPDAMELAYRAVLSLVRSLDAAL
jgi:hypothetical protein